MRERLVESRKRLRGGRVSWGSGSTSKIFARGGVGRAEQTTKYKPGGERIERGEVAVSRPERVRRRQWSEEQRQERNERSIIMIDGDAAPGWRLGCLAAMMGCGW
jgi:hypothetical protein